MSKTKSLRNVKDEVEKFKLSEKAKGIWTVIAKNKKEATIQSAGGSNRFKPLSTKVFPV